MVRSDGSEILCNICAEYATGDSALYQYDTEDGTYQAFTAPADNTDESSGAALPGSIGKLISDHILLFLIALAVVILVMLILIIVFAVKLVHRNQELDDLYDEYDIPYDDEEDEDKKADTVKPDKKRRRKLLRSRPMMSTKTTTMTMSTRTTTTKMTAITRR